MGISQNIAQCLQRSSWIREMFEQGAKLKQQHGPENVFDFSLGNPEIDPPEEFHHRLQQIVSQPQRGMHRYMPNAGYVETRAAVAQRLHKDTGIAFKARNIIMTVGAAGALNVVLKTILDPGDEVMVIAPYFVEYIFYINNHGGVPVIIESNDQFGLDFADFEKKLTDKTKAVIVNYPNNPTGVMYSQAEIEKLGEFFSSASQKLGRDIYLISDEPYREIIFDGVNFPSIFSHYPHSIVAYSYSKSLGIPGERLGYLAFHPGAAYVDELIGGATFTNRTLGFVNSPALMQRICSYMQDIAISPKIYQDKRDRFYGALTKIGFQCVKPGGAFYLFPKTPMDDVDFAKLCMEHKILIVPGSGFGRKGYCRISYSVADDLIERSLPVFEKIAKSYL